MPNKISNPIALGTSCLGLHASHTLDRKLRAISSHGFTGVEIVYNDLERYSSVRNMSMLQGANLIKHLCKSLGLTILSLCPFENFEGAQAPLDERLREAKRWISIARVLGTKWLQIPAMYDRSGSRDEEIIVYELQKLAEVGMGEPGEAVIGIAYEPMSWSIAVSTWEDALRVHDLVDRENFKLCIDTYHVLSKVWGSPHTQSGVLSSGPEDLEDSLNRMVKEVPREKIAYVQLSDAEKVDPPFSKEHPWYLEGEDPLFSWSKHGRPFPLEGEMGGYTPVHEVVKALLEGVGWKGWVSFETFDRRMRREEFAVEDGARRAKRSLERLEEALKAENGRAKL